VDNSAGAFSFFAASHNQESSCAISSEDAVAATDCDSYVSDEFLFLKGITAGATDDLFQAKNPVFDSSGWTVADADFTTAFGTATKGIGFAIEASSTVLGTAAVSGHRATAAATGTVVGAEAEPVPRRGGHRRRRKVTARPRPTSKTFAGLPVNDQ
jgi:hypothetical protein